MIKIYAIIDSSGIVINTILLDLDNSTWPIPEGCTLMDAEIEGLGIGDQA